MRRKKNTASVSPSPASSPTGTLGSRNMFVNNFMGECRFFFLPGGAEIYTTPKVDMNERTKKAHTIWPIDNIATQGDAIEDLAKDTRVGIPANDFFKNFEAARAAAAKRFPKLPISIVELCIPAKLIKDIDELAKNDANKVFSENLMTYVVSITEFSPRDKFTKAMVYQNETKRNEPNFVKQIEPEMSPSNNSKLRK